MPDAWSCCSIHAGAAPCQSRTSCIVLHHNLDLQGTHIDRPLRQKQGIWALVLGAVVVQKGSPLSTALIMQLHSLKPREARNLRSTVCSAPVGGLTIVDNFMACSSFYLSTCTTSSALPWCGVLLARGRWLKSKQYGTDMGSQGV